MKRRRTLLTILSFPFLCVLCYGIAILGSWIATSQTLDLPAPTWKGITPGQTTSEEVIKIFGNPQQVWCKDQFDGYAPNPFDGLDVISYGIYNTILPCRPDEFIYFYQNPLGDKDVQVTIIVRSEKVWALRVQDRYPFSSTEQTQVAVFSNFIQEHGKPERVGWSKLGDIGNLCDRAVIYPKLGILLHVNYDSRMEKNYAYRVTYFRPMSLWEAETVFNLEANFRGPQAVQQGRYRCGSMDPWGFNQ